ncbi:1-deoxy-D-xylulose-5-phosphate reductoisomerase [[Clostridium] cellulosi]|nr:MAG: 1-deoxy-D-xylulose-5-phosphate reductoisomerase [[Clostridium] cellulosi]
MQEKTISVIGSTGSIGTQALDVARMMGFRIAALAAGKNIDLLEKQVREFRPEIAAVADERAAAELKLRIKDLPCKVLGGNDGICEAASAPSADIVLDSIVGIAGLAPALAAIRAKKTLALANKESLVSAGEIVMREAEENGVRILPVDSEHSAVFQCLQGSANPKREIKKIILTASGGPFFGRTYEELQNVTPVEALHHPNWAMGAKITIDSATLMNKGLELVEACWLFSLPPEKIEIVVHRQSIIHSAVEFQDGAVIAQLGVPDMRIPIQYALTYPQRFMSPAKALDLFEVSRLTFEKPDLKTFKCLDVMIKAAERGGLCTAAASAANEEAVSLFLSGKIRFTDIGDLVESAAFMPLPHEMTLDNVYEVDRAARAHVHEELKQLKIALRN